MTALIIDSAASAGHPVPPGHPEHQGRYDAARAALEGVANARWLNSRAAVRSELERFHTAAHIERVLGLTATVSEGDWAALDADTQVTQSSAAAGLHAAGGVVEAVDRVMRGEGLHAFCLARPPGHHAEPDRAMGFCLFNSIAVGACHALEAHGLDRVAIVDVDVHHGNGSQCLAEVDERVFFASLHQAPLYPGTGTRKETGRNGNVLNIPLPANTPAAVWRQHFEGEVLPALKQFQPQMLFVSAGFDAYADDPLGGFLLQDVDYAWIAQELAGVAEETADSRLVSVMEGGYDCPALGRAAAAFTAAL
ncbi:histone deacetylase family protein [Maricaulis sp.]|uniref:histone deacetylase family protein n=1 Tax=Maricaulis sp. TaxID=1486257 RepID=UPI002601751D|nr:histone deacetylase family protein [Maricaulis sp.]